MNVGAHVEMLRPYTLWYPGLVGTGGAALAGGSGRQLVLAWLVPTLGWTAAMYGGDYFDRKLDAAAKPGRPIPSGRVTARAARRAMLLLAAAGSAVGATVNPRSTLLAAAAFAGGIAYSVVCKGSGLSGNAVRGALTACAFLFGAMTVAPWPPARLLPLAGALLLHDAATNLVGTLRDVAGDAAGGYRTTAVRRSPGTALTLAGALYAGGVAVFAVSVSGTPARVMVAVAVVIGGAAFRVGSRAVAAGPLPDRAEALRAHALLVVERIVLAASLVATAGDGATAAAILVPSLLATVLFQRALRERHERPAHGVPTAAEIDAYVDRELARLATGPSPRALRGWNRVLRIRLREPELSVALTTAGGRVRRAEPTPEAEADLTVTTDGATFRDVFLEGRTDPRRAYLARRVRITGTAADMVRLNQLFGEFRRSAPVTYTAPVSPERPSTTLPPRIVISDTTLRDGEQMPGVAFSAHDKLILAHALDAAGVAVLEAGFPAVSEDEADAVRQIAAAGLNAVVQALARPVAADVDAAVRAGAASIAVFAGTSEAHVHNKLRTTHRDLRRRVAAAVTRAKAAGCTVVFAAEDATRTPLADLLAMYAAAVDAGADAVGLADTAGVATPERLAELVHAIAGFCPVPLGVHCHDDLGLATANSLAALHAGASAVQCSVAGIGERAGNAALEQVVLALEVGYGHPTGIDLTALPALAGHVARLTGHPVPATAPVVGAHAFTHESGLHVDGVTRDPSTYEPYPPELVGAERRVVLGKHSGSSAVRAALAARGVGADARTVDDVLAWLKERPNPVAAGVAEEVR
ncbi:MAG TPA: UbiA family prenyltransferase [Mycobacteriales bacterium]|nr:UbiA family prenyltransferase [Mycobacteriales bacterium]